MTFQGTQQFYFPYVTEVESPKRMSLSILIAFPMISNQIRYSHGIACYLIKRCHKDMQGPTVKSAINLWAESPPTICLIWFQWWRGVYLIMIGVEQWNLTEASSPNSIAWCTLNRPGQQYQWVKKLATLLLQHPPQPHQYSRAALSIDRSHRYHHQQIQVVDFRQLVWLYPLAK